MRDAAAIRAVKVHAGTDRAIRLEQGRSGEPTERVAEDPDAVNVDHVTEQPVERRQTSQQEPHVGDPLADDSRQQPVGPPGSRGRFLRTIFPPGSCTASVS